MVVWGSVQWSRSLGRFPPPSPWPDDAPMPSLRFVTKVRCGVFPPEVNLDDLADEFFWARVEFEDDDDGEEEIAGLLTRKLKSTRARSVQVPGGSCREGSLVGEAPPRGMPGRQSCCSRGGALCRGHRLSGEAWRLMRPRR